MIIAVTLFILAAVVVVGYISDLLRSEKLDREVIIGGSVLALVEIALFSTAGVGLMKGKKWARWVMVVICAIGSMISLVLLVAGLAAPAEKGSPYMWGQIAGTAFLIAAFAAPCFYLWRSVSSREFFVGEKNA